MQTTTGRTMAAADEARVIRGQLRSVWSTRNRNDYQRRWIRAMIRRLQDLRGR